MPALCGALLESERARAARHHHHHMTRACSLVLLLPAAAAAALSSLSNAEICGCVYRCGFRAEFVRARALRLCAEPQLDCATLAAATSLLQRAGPEWGGLISATTNNNNNNGTSHNPSPLFFELTRTKSGSVQRSRMDASRLFGQHGGMARHRASSERLDTLPKSVPSFLSFSLSLPSRDS